MNSKECLEKLKEMPTCSECELYGKCFERPLCNELYNTIKQDLNKLENLEKENQELKNTILSLELDTCIPELRKENTKLKNIIKLLEDNLQLVLKKDIDPLLNRKVYAVGISKNYKIYSGFEITQEQYELIEEYKKNER